MEIPDADQLYMVAQFLLGGRTDAFVQTVIMWSYEDRCFRTRGLDADRPRLPLRQP